MFLPWYSSWRACWAIKGDRFSFCCHLQLSITPVAALSSRPSLNMSKITFVCLSLGLILALTQGSPTGAPLLACEDMIPMHDVEPQVTASPFVTTPASVCYLNFNISRDSYLNSFFELTVKYRLKSPKVAAFDWHWLPWPPPLHSKVQPKTDEIISLVGKTCFDCIEIRKKVSWSLLSTMPIRHLDHLEASRPSAMAKRSIVPALFSRFSVSQLLINKMDW